jgi:hypothetical protein
MATPILASPVLVQLLTNSYNEDPFPNKILKLIRDSAKHCREISLAEYNKHNNYNSRTEDGIRVQGTHGRARAWTWLGRLGKAGQGQGAWLGWAEGEGLGIRDEERHSCIG